MISVIARAGEKPKMVKYYEKRGFVVVDVVKIANGVLEWRLKRGREANSTA